MSCPNCNSTRYTNVTVTVATDEWAPDYARFVDCFTIQVDSLGREFPDPGRISRPGNPGTR